MNALYYQEYYELERKHWWFLARGEIIMAHLELMLADRTATGQKLRILNIGAATGRSSELLSRLGEVSSVEYDRECCLFTKEKLGIDIIHASILELPYDEEQFDLVCAFDVIEHVADDGLAVQEMHRVCRKDGLICVTVPAYEFLWSQHDEVNQHFRRYTARQLRKLFETTGSCRYLSYFNFWLFFPIAFFRLLAKILPLQNKSRKDAGSDFFVMGGSLLQKIFYRIFRSELFFIKNKIRLWTGVSLITTWQRR